MNTKFSIVLLFLDCKKLPVDFHASWDNIFNRILIELEGGDHWVSN